MPHQTQPRFSQRLHVYIFAVVLCGAAVVSHSVSELVQQVPEYRNQWLSLVALTVLSGLLPVSLPSVNVSISISETFVIAGTLLFGTSGGTVLVLLDALFISLYLAWSKRLRWQQILFNLAASPLSIWLAASISQIDPLFRTAPDFGALFIVQVTIFSSLYFVLNTWLVAFAVAIQQGVHPRVATWWGHFREVLVNYAAGGSIAALLVYNTREVKPEFIFAIVPLLALLFLTYHWSNQRIEVERERNSELNRVFLSTIEALALAIDAKDQVTHGHIRRVQRYTMALAEALGITGPKELDAIRAAALLHDTGKLAVPEYILNKPGPLTPSEFERMKVHADVGADILKSIDFPYPVEPIVRHHHEQWDGSGYPSGLRGQEIPIGARILSVVDCYDALTSDRPYRPRMARPQAEQVLKDRRGKAYDPWVIDEFLKLLDRLEEIDAAERTAPGGTASSIAIPARLDVISATTAEEREFSELRRELSRAPDIRSATEAFFKHTKRIVPAAAVALYVPKPRTNDLTVVACFGVGATAIAGMQVSVGDRISGWAFAHAQLVLNSDATLELGPVARTFAVPLRYAAAVPIVDGQVVAVMMVYSSEPLERDHRRLLENAATLFVSSVSGPIVAEVGEVPSVVPGSDPNRERIH